MWRELAHLCNVISDTEKADTEFERAGNGRPDAEHNLVVFLPEDLLSASFFFVFDPLPPYHYLRPAANLVLPHLLSPLPSLLSSQWWLRRRRPGGCD